MRSLPPDCHADLGRRARGGNARDCLAAPSMLPGLPCRRTGSRAWDSTRCVVVPRLIHRVMGDERLLPLRQRVVAGCGRPRAGARHRRRPQPAALRPRGDRAAGRRSGTLPPGAGAADRRPGCRSRSGCWSSRPSTCRWPTPASTRWWSPGPCASSPIRWRRCARRTGCWCRAGGCGSSSTACRRRRPRPLAAPADAGLVDGWPAAAGSTGAPTGWSSGPGSRSSELETGHLAARAAAAHLPLPGRGAPVSAQGCRSLAAATAASHSAVGLGDADGCGK